MNLSLSRIFQTDTDDRPLQKQLQDVKFRSTISSALCESFFANIIT
jgi:hypothetical protein